MHATMAWPRLLHVLRLDTMSSAHIQGNVWSLSACEDAQCSHTKQ